MQAQSAIRDPPRFNDLHTALTGVVTRAERQALMLSACAARLAYAAPPPSLSTHTHSLGIPATRGKGRAERKGEEKVKGGRQGRGGGGGWGERDGSRRSQTPFRPRSRSDTPLGYGVYLRDSTVYSAGGGLILPTEVREAMMRLGQCTRQAALQAETVGKIDLAFSHEQVLKLRSQVEESYRDGQWAVTKLGLLLSQRTMLSDWECHSSVTAGTENDEVEEFRLSLPVSPEQLRASTGSGSHELALRTLQGLYVGSMDERQTAQVLDHAVEFEAVHGNDWGVAKVISHARPQSETWRLASDLMFDIDFKLFGVALAGEGEAEVQGFKACGGSDMYSVNILVETSTQAKAMREFVSRVRFLETELVDAGVPVTAETLLPRVLRSGRGGMLLLWGGSVVHLKVLTLDEHYVESELQHRARVAQAEGRRESLCQELESNIALFRFARDALHWLFVSSSMRHTPSCDRIALRLVGSPDAPSQG